MNLWQVAPKLHGFRSGGPAYPARGFCSAHGGGQPAGIDAVASADGYVFVVPEYNQAPGRTRPAGPLPLVIDEVGYIPFEPEAANLFLHLVSGRYQRASLIVTSNKAPVKAHMFA